MRPVLNRSVILAASREMARRQGVEAVGVRSVASELGATPMALYRYVSDAADLRNATLGLILESLPPAPGSIEELDGWAHAFRAWLRDVPGLSRLVLLRWFELPPLLDTVESLLAVFARAGNDGFELVAATNALLSFVLARGELEEAVRASGVHRSLPWGGGEAARPLLTSLRSEYEVARLDEHFEYGFDLLVRALIGRCGEAG